MCSIGVVFDTLRHPMPLLMLLQCVCLRQFDADLTSERQLTSRRRDASVM